MNKEEVRNFVKARIMEAGYTMSELVDVLSTDYGWSDGLSNFSAKLGRGSLRYAEAVLERAGTHSIQRNLSAVQPGMQAKLPGCFICLRQFQRKEGET